MTAEKEQLRFSQGVYAVEAVKRAAYRLSDHAVCDISLDGNDIVVTISGRSSSEGPVISALVERFKTEVLDADLRLTAAAETDGVRNTILSHVFSRTGLTGNE